MATTRLDMPQREALILFIRSSDGTYWLRDIHHQSPISPAVLALSVMHLAHRYDHGYEGGDSAYASYQLTWAGIQARNLAVRGLEVFVKPADSKGMPAEVQATPPRKEAGEFQREDRYIVIKRKDLENAPALMAYALQVALDGLREHLPERECLVIEGDWPEYEPTWAAIQARTEGHVATTEPAVEGDVVARLTEIAYRDTAVSVTVRAEDLRALLEMKR